MRPQNLVWFVLAGLLVSSLSMAVEVPTYYRDVVPILQENCQTCHRPEGENIGGVVAPMALMSYQEVRPWAKSIARVVKAREMPPWFATAATRGQFLHERVLSQEEIDTLVTWSRQGAPAGDPSLAPTPRRFVEETSGGWSLGQPDLVVTFDEPYFVEDDVEDLNVNLTTVLTPEQLPKDTWVQAIEFRVGGRNVHHMCASATPPGESAGFGKFSRHSLGCIALGAESQVMPEGFGMLLARGARVRFSMHYHKEPGPDSGFYDQSELGFYFARKPVKHRVRYSPIGNFGFEIPPGHPRWKVGAAHTFEEDTFLLTLWPHAHLRAVAARYDAVYPDGRRELLLDVPHYDQEWQTTYQYKEPRFVPAGTRLEVVVWYDNTADRGQERGFDADRGVYFGPATTDEMMLGFVNYAPATPSSNPDVSTEATAGGAP